MAELEEIAPAVVPLPEMDVEAVPFSAESAQDIKLFGKW